MNHSYNGYPKYQLKRCACTKGNKSSIDIDWDYIGNRGNDADWDDEAVVAYDEAGAPIPEVNDRYYLYYFVLGYLFLMMVACGLASIFS